MIVTGSVVLFAVFMLIPWDFGSYFVCMLLPIGYMMMCGGFCAECGERHRAAAYAGMGFAAVYTVLVLLVYFAQTTAVRLDSLDEQAMRMLDYGKGGLFFYYDLLGYGMMALSTFFIGLTVGVRDGADRWLKRLMLGHGVFFFSCLLMPMTGMLSGEGNGVGGTIALEVWCAYFTPIGVLSFVHFRKSRI